ncbi:MAG TPA: D-alanyl-D-alanine carboxypeptidase/D-alanyl-D-alanine-endopeptidase [Burkholderiales bacterium]|nr:D-alanyl-D-alanine carboxypeptidase/D-alanyl-D-alanine-endopeptidase [Burkholderiales bacterium]
MAPRVFLLLLLSAIAFVAGAQNVLPPTVAQALASARIPVANVAVVVQEVGVFRETLRVNAAAPMNPASVMKLVTTYAALEKLGPAYRWKTEAWVTGSLRDGVLEGDLVFKGGGDPRLDLESFWIMLRALRGKGLREIRGDLVLDRGYFEGVGGDPGRFDGDPFRPYNVLPDALLVNFRSLRFTFIPDPEHGAVRIYVDPRPPALELVNTLRLTDGPCPEGRAFRELLKPEFEPARQRVAYAGVYPASCGEKDLNVALLEPNDQVAGIFRQLWAELGGSWTGGVREGPVPAGARLFHSHDSPLLAEIVRDTNKFSNNIMGRHLFLTLGAEAGGIPGNLQKASVALRGWLAAKGLAAPELVLENGVGLSRTERISAATLAALLQSAWRSSVMPEYISSLPIVGLDGTMRRRLKDDDMTGQAHIKTGLLNDARAIAGYVLDRRGRREVVVMLVNHPNAPESQAAMDALLRWVYER